MVVKFMDKIKEIRNLFLEKGDVVGEIEKTFENYDNKGFRIKRGVPTITTEFCEIGSYDGVVYFTFVIYSDSYNQNLVKNLKKLSNFQIYGFKNFKENFYPKENFNLKDLGNKIKKEKYLQINFDYLENSDAVYFYTEYQKIKKLCFKSGIKIVNQLKVNLI